MADQRDTGRRRVFAAIRSAGRIARVDLARITGISPATVTALTAELLREGLIEETGPSQDADLRRGRPRVDLKVRGAAHAVAGIKLSHSAVSVAVIDFEGELIGEATRRLTRHRHSVEEAITLFREVLDSATAEAGLTLADLSGVGLGVAGTVDANRGLVYWCPDLRERNVPLRDRMTEALGLPVFIDNDANLVAMAEMYFGYGREVRDFVVLTIENGVGMGIVINREIYRGTRGCGAEFGHTKVQLDGALCRCGQRGCLEAYVGDYALLREAAISTDFADQSTTRQKLQSLVEAAQAGDHTAQSIFERAGKIFAMGLANIVNIFDPQLIILSGERMQFDFLYADDVLDSIRRSIVQIDTPPPEVLIHKWGDLMWAKGAATYAIEGVAEIALQEIATHAG